ncbi:MAG: NAD(P)-dependent oxidoreductase [Bacteroidota bacterium]
MRVLFIDSVHHALWNGLTADGHYCVDGTTLSREEILQQMPVYDGVVIRSRIRLDQHFFDVSSNLKFIARSGAGMENIDLEYAAEKGVHCINSPEGNKDAVGEHAVGMLLMLLNNLGRADREVRKGVWIREANRGVELNGMTVALIGYGTMGRAVAKRLSGFGCEVIAYDKYLTSWPDGHARRVEMDEVFIVADVVSLHVPLTDETRLMADTEYFARFKKNIWMINTARGGCLSLDALADAIKAGKVLGACLDVLEYEDSSFEKFSLSETVTNPPHSWTFLTDCDRVVFSPHIAGWTHESYRKLSEVLLDKIRKIFPS